MNRITFFDLFVKLSLIVDTDDGYTFSDYTLVLAETTEGLAVKEIRDVFLNFNEADRDRWKKEFEEYCKVARERNRYFLFTFFAEKEKLCRLLQKD